MFLFLLILQSLVALALITVILMQRSEGGGLAGGGSPSGMMSARGAADFLTRSTAILGASFVILSIALAALAASRAAPPTIDPAIANNVAPAPAPLPMQGLPGQPAPGAVPAPAPAAPAGNQQGIPLAQ